MDATSITFAADIDQIGEHIDHYLQRYDVLDDFQVLSGVRVTPDSLGGAVTFVLEPDDMSAATTLAIAHALGVCVEDIVHFDNPDTFLEGLENAEDWADDLSSLTVNDEAERAFRAIKEWIILNS